METIGLVSVRGKLIYRARQIKSGEIVKMSGAPNGVVVLRRGSPSIAPVGRGSTELEDSNRVEMIETDTGGNHAATAGGVAVVSQSKTESRWRQRVQARYDRPAQ